MKPWKPELSDVRIPGEIHGGAKSADSASHLVKMTPAERLLRERFANEYIMDFDATAAARRVGFTGPSAVEAGRKLMEEVVTNRLIAERIRAYDPAKDISLGRVIAGLVEEATSKGVGTSHSARVAAWMGIAKVVGMGEANKSETNVNLGGVMVVPPTPSIEEWEKMAVDSQAKLKADVTK